MDLTPAIVPKSDQINADDLISGPITVTIKSVTKGSDEQPVNVHLVETPTRAYRPSKSMARVMVKAWGKESDDYTGHRMTLYRDPEVKWAGQKTGGIKISAMSHIDRGFTMALTETRGQRKPHTVEVLPDVAPEPAPTPSRLPEPSAERVAACTDKATLDRMWQASGPERRAQIEGRMFELGLTDGAA